MRTVSTSSIVVTIIGDQSGDLYLNVPGTSTGIPTPTGIVVDSGNGNVFVSSQGGNQIVLLSPSTGLVTLVAGASAIQGISGDGGPATSALLASPDGLYLESTGNLIVGHYGYHQVRWVYSVSPSISPTNAPTMVPTTIKPTLTPTLGPSVMPSVSQFPTVTPTTRTPTVSPTTSSPSTTRSSLNNIDTVAGNGVGLSSGTGGLATAASFYNPRSVIQDTLGMTYIAEGKGHCIRRFPTSVAIVTAFAGVCNNRGFSGDGGRATSAQINNPMDVVADSIGGVYISEIDNSRVRYVSSLNIISTIAGTGNAFNDGDGGKASNANLQAPLGMYLSSTGSLYVMCYSLVRVISGGNINLFAGIVVI